MKYTLTILACLLAPFYSFSQTEVDTVDWSQLEQRDDIWYKKGSEIPCSGVIVRFWGNGQQQQETHMANGQREGIETNWYENGQKKSETNYSIGQREGIATTWYDNGQRKSKIKYVHGQESNEIKN